MVLPTAPSTALVVYNPLKDPGEATQQHKQKMLTVWLKHSFKEQFTYDYRFYQTLDGKVALLDEKNQRHFQYRRISEYLKTLSDHDLSKLLEQGVLVHSGGCGRAVELTIDGIPLFVKLIPLNELERKGENTLSTKNLFKLPSYYQYRVGSSGFSAWREVTAHLHSTDWVLAGESQNFPLMYHWRALDNPQKKAPLDEVELKNEVKNWNNASPIGERLRANHYAAAHIALFIEYMPQSLQSWLDKQSSQGESAVEKAVSMVEQELLETTTFINTKRMLHCDSHFLNILTDGKHLYFSDFGLATSEQFELSAEERQFFQTHQNYDRYTAITELVNWIVYNTFGADHFDEALTAYASGKTPPSPTLTPYLASIVIRYAPIALKMNHFFEMLRNGSKEFPYPAAELEQLWNHVK